MSESGMYKIDNPTNRNPRKLHLNFRFGKSRDRAVREKPPVRAEIIKVRRIVTFVIGLVMLDQISPAQSTSDDFRQVATEQFNGDDFDGMLGVCTRWAKKYPDSSKAHSFRGVANNLLGNYEEAILDFTRALEIDADLIEIYRQRGQARFFIGKNTKAIEDFSRAIEIDPKRAIFYRDRGAAKRNSGDYAGAIADYSTVVKLGETLNIPFDPVQVQIELSKGASNRNAIKLVYQAFFDLYKDDETDQSLWNLHNALISPPLNLSSQSILRNREAMLRKLISNFEYSSSVAKGVEERILRWSDVEGCLGKDLAVLSTILVTYQNLRNQGKVDTKTVVAIEKVIADRILKSIGRKIAYNIKHCTMESYLKNSSAQCVIYSQFSYLFAKAVGLEVKAIESEGHCSTCIVLTDGNYVDWDTTHKRMGSPFGLEECYQPHISTNGLFKLVNGVGFGGSNHRFHWIRFLSQDGMQALVYNNVGSRKFVLGDREGSVKEFSRALTFDPNFAGAYSNRALANGELGDWAQALPDSARSITMNPYSPSYYNIRANAKGMLDDKDGAAKDYRRAIALNTSSTQGYTARASAKFEIGDWEGAIKDFSQAIAHDPTDPYPYHKRGVAKSRRGDNRGAIEDYSQAIARDSQNVDLFLNRGTAKSKTGDHRGGIQDFSAALKIDQKNLFAYYMRGFAKSKLGDSTGAAEDYKRALTIDSNFAPAKHGLETVRQQRKK